MKDKKKKNFFIIFHKFYKNIIELKIIYFKYFSFNSIFITPILLIDDSHLSRSKLMTYYAHQNLIFSSIQLIIL
jgi:hypothetical protein